jgi:ABC-type phosphate transport system permease subunit
MAAVLALGRSVVETVSVMRVINAVKMAVPSLPIPVATTAVTVKRAKDASVTTTQIRSFAALQVVELSLLLRRLNPNLLPRL